MLRSASRRDPSPRRRPGDGQLPQRQRRSAAERRLQRRNALVTAHLPLARSIAARLSPPRHGSLDDMVQVASLGLIRAVEAFDPRRAVSFSSFAVPYLRGALLHELRDRQSPVRIPRVLWELRQQVVRLQEERRRNGQSPLDHRSLAQRLACGVEQLQEVECLGAVSAPRSLDAPLPSGLEGEVGATLLERLADPCSLPAGAPSSGGIAADDPAERAMVGWLAGQMAALDPQRRDLLEGRLKLNCTWVELGQQLGIHPRMAQRRCDATLADLRQAAAAWLAGGPFRAAEEARAQPPATGRGQPPSGSAGR